MEKKNFNHGTMVGGIVRIVIALIAAVALALCVALCVGCGEKTENFSVLFKDGDTTVAEVVVKAARP